MLWNFIEPFTDEVIQNGFRNCINKTINLWFARSRLAYILTTKLLYSLKSDRLSFVQYIYPGNGLGLFWLLPAGCSGFFTISSLISSIGITGYSLRSILNPSSASFAAVSSETSKRFQTSDSNYENYTILFKLCEQAIVYHPNHVVLVKPKIQQNKLGLSWYIAITDVKVENSFSDLLKNLKNLITLSLNQSEIYYLLVSSHL